MAKHADACAEPLNGLTADDLDDERGEDGSVPVEDYEAALIDEADERPSDGDVDDDAETVGRQRRVRITPLTAAGVVFVVALGCLIGWLGYLRYQTLQGQAQRNEFVEAARQGALNLTTIDYTTIDEDVRRILDSSVGALHADFEQRSQPFIDVVKKVRSTSQGTVTAAGLESQDGDQAQVLVAVLVKTSSAAGPESQPRGWRMRIGVQKVGDFAKVSNVQFVP